MKGAEMEMDVYIAQTILTGFLVGALFHVIAWVSTFGLRMLEEVLK